MTAPKEAGVHHALDKEKKDDCQQDCEQELPKSKRGWSSFWFPIVHGARCCGITLAECPLSLADCFALRALLPRLQRNRQSYNFARLGIEASHYFWRTRLHPPAQFFQPLSHLDSVSLASNAMFAIRLVDF